MSKIFGTQFHIGSYIDSVSKSEGTNTNGVFERTEKGLAWKGNGSSALIDYTSITLYSPQTIEVWWKPKIKEQLQSFLSGNTGASTILRYDGVGDDDIWFYTTGSGGDDSHQFVDVGIVANKWVHLLIVRSGTSVSLYVNNILHSTGVLNDSDEQATSRYIGRRNLADMWITGWLAKLELHNTAYTEKQRSQAYRDFLRATPIVVSPHVKYGDWNKPSVDRGRGLVASYNMIPSSGTLVDVSGGGNNGTIPSGNDFSQVTNGLFCKGLNDINLVGGINLGNIHSVCFRIKPLDFVNRVITTVYGAGSYLRLSNTTTISYYNGVGSRTDITVPTMYIEQFYNIVFTRNSTALTVYINGELAGTATHNNTAIWAVATLFGIGTAQAFYGTCDDLVIYNRLLTHADAQDYHNSFHRVVLNTTPSKWDAVGSVPFGMIPGTGTYTTQELTTQDAVLKELDIGTKVLQCDVAGTIAIPFTHAYGTPEIYVYKGGDGNNLRIQYISTTNELRQTCYEFTLNVAEQYVINEFVATAQNTKLGSAVSYIDINTWYATTMGRTLDGETTALIKGGGFGSTYQSVTATSGTNPFTDNSITTSEYIVLDCDVGDRVLIKNWKENVRQ